MRFLLTEDWEQDLLELNQKENDTRTEIRGMFMVNDFKETKSLNGSSFDKKKDNIIASFYISTKLDYTGYVTDSSDNSSNFSVKGKIDGAVDGAQKIIDQFDYLTQ